MTGITKEDVKDAPSIEDVMPHFLNFIENYTLIAHNAKFDMEFIQDKLYKLGYKRISNKSIDTLLLSRQHIRDLDNRRLKSYSLESLKDELDLWYGSQYKAIGDCRVCQGVYIECKKSIEIKQNIADYM